MISVIIATENNLSSLRQCLQGLAAQTRPPSAVLIAVYGKADREAISHLTISELSLQVLDFRGQNLNQARNSALDYVETEFVLFLSDEVTPAPNLILLHAQEHETISRDERFLTLGHVDWNPNQDISFLMGYVLGEGGQLFDYTQIRNYYNTGFEFCYAANLMAKTAFLRSNKFDPEIEYVLGDLELGYRLEKEKEAQIVYVAAAVAHFNQIYNLKDLSERQFQKGRAAYRISKKHAWLDYDEFKIQKQLATRPRLTDAYFKLLENNLLKVEEMHRLNIANLTLEGKPVSRFVEQILAAVYHQWFASYFALGVCAGYDEELAVQERAETASAFLQRLPKGNQAQTRIDIELDGDVSLLVSTEERVIEQLELKLKDSADMEENWKHLNNVVKQREDEIKVLQKALKERNGQSAG